jgi:hypothetical protein
MTMIASIRERLAKLRSIAAAKLTVANAPEMYVQDVTVLLTVVQGLTDSLARLAQRLEEKNTGQCAALEIYQARIRQQIETMVVKELSPKKPAGPQITVNG